MSAQHFAQAAETAGMDSWKGLHVGFIPGYRDKKRHAKYRWGAKKGLRRARRRLGQNIVLAELEAL